jgi:rhamnosyltransferase
MAQQEYKTKMLGVVTLYNPNPEEAVTNIKRYIDDIDALIIWDNSPLEKNLKATFLNELAGSIDKIIWKGNGKNYCIAPVINYALSHSKDYHYDLILLMDDDSRWLDFQAYRNNAEDLFLRKGLAVFTPYVQGCDDFLITSDYQKKKLFINSGTILPSELLTIIGSIDEDAFPLDALDHDIALSVTALGFPIVCLTKHKLIHSIGQPQRLGFFHLFTPNYNRFRTYSMTRSHTICYRKHKKLLDKELKEYYFYEILLWKFVRIILAEPDKYGRMKAFLKGLYEGIRYKIIRK